ncbi:ADP-L-glycero-D-manno-heptose-6-epimerase [Candidatus Falkowbacteria bacterium CG10_big_fil_rev_8_21_14_0_10_43_10]|uniref:ADP-L-glycero-D-manno-heptose-6-epimerase n=1 Tax=Candidatus Falkowbacteria bacterium CG10_big_fil_rev_8_21_14_0_10_43_10 TaxID=1974567 RepID=A0A2H0V394_9BACT|nr:MAG: ADP-L-glycero-D-manno-heptose-6-epimerase [Candidatus Falkowbacteria bacterium CG10_big_fil_rev_8_21_14_0_10_43_10]
MKILVTGGAGFIGSHLCEKLAAQGHDVASLDNYFNGSEKNHVKGVKYIKGETKDIKEHIKEAPDMIYHLGEYSRVLTSFEDINLVWRLNIIGTLGVLEFCRKNKTRLLYAGSSTKFGDSIGGRTESPYAWSKANNTELVNNYGRWFNLPYVITYFYNVYGGREITDGKYATLIGIFTRKHKNKEPLSVVKPGTQRRAFTYIDDIVDGLVLAGAKGAGDGYCIGSEKTYSVMEIAKLFGGEIKMLPEKKGDRMSSTIDLSKMNELGWSAKHSVEDYIKSVTQN